MAEKLSQHENEQGKEETPQDSQNTAVDRPSASDHQEDFGPPPEEENQEQHLEVIVNVVASIYNGESGGQFTASPQTRRPGSPEGDYLEEESCYLTDKEDLLQDSGGSTGYYPCYLTYDQLPPNQTEDTEDPPKQSGSTDVGIQVGDTFLEKASKSEGGMEADASMEEAKKQPWPNEWSLPPSPEEASGINIKDQALMEGGDRSPPAPSCPSAPATSRRGVNHLLCWVRNVFRRPSPSRPPPSPAPVGERVHKPISARLRGWILRHRGRVQPHP